jgi:pilus assembly protein CpaE
MHTTLSTLLLGVDGAAITEIRTTLAGLDGVATTCTDGGFHDGLQLARAKPPDVVMVVMDGDARSALTLMEETNRVLPATQIFALSRDDTTANIVKAMRAGATEFLGLPVEPTQMLKALIKATTLNRLNQPAATTGEIWAVYSPKGGAGTTTTAANLGIELHAELGKSVCLVDLDFQSGDLALALNMTPVYTMVDIALNFRRLDSVFLQGTLTRHPSGVYLLAAPPHGSAEGTVIPGDQIRTVLELLRSMYDVVIVDTPRALTEETLAALWTANRVVLLIERSLPFLRGYRRTMDVLGNIGVPRERIDVVIAKHTTSKAAVSLDEAKKSLDLTVKYLLPRDEETALEAVNKGLPLVDVRRNSPLRKGIAELAKALLNQQEAEPKKRKNLLNGLFSS